jgi:SagB-type dehydrogenase family enzyme
MKKVIILTVALLLAFCGAQAQKKTPAKKVSSQSATSNLNADGSAITLPTLETIELPMTFEGLHAPLMEAFKLRATQRDIREEEIPMEFVSSLLWSAYGINRPEEGKRVVPSAINAQEYDIYLFTREGIYLYNAEKNSIEMKVKGDYREKISQQKFFAVAPISIVMVANYDRMKKFKQVEDRDFYAAVDAGYISQNIYLFCASASLNTVACGGINRDEIHKILGITNGRAMLAHPVGLR